MAESKSAGEAETLTAVAERAADLRAARDAEQVAALALTDAIKEAAKAGVPQRVIAA